MVRLHRVLDGVLSLRRSLPAAAAAPATGPIEAATNTPLPPLPTGPQRAGTTRRTDIRRAWTVHGRVKKSIGCWPERG